MQVSRPGISGANAHDARFVSFNVFPESFSKNKHSPIVDFTKQLPRSEKMYRATMSDIYYIGNSEKDQDPRLKPKNILHFSRMHCHQPPLHQLETEKERKHRAKINKLSGLD